MSEGSQDVALEQAKLQVLRVPVFKVVFTSDSHESSLPPPYDVT